MCTFYAISDSHNFCPGLFRLLQDNEFSVADTRTMREAEFRETLGIIYFVVVVFVVVVNVAVVILIRLPHFDL